MDFFFIVMFISDNESFNPSLWEEQRKQRAQVAFECDEDKDEREAPPRVSLFFLFSVWNRFAGIYWVPYVHPVLFWQIQRNVLVLFLAFKAFEVLLIMYHIISYEGIGQQYKTMRLKTRFHSVYKYNRKKGHCFSPCLSLMTYLYIFQE